MFRRVFNLVLLAHTVAGLPSLAYAEKIAFMYGGSGEEDKAENFFEKDYIRMKAALESRGYEVIVYFDRDAKKVPGSAGPATLKNVRGGLASLVNRVKKDDQVLLIGHAHGGEGKDGTLGHPMAMDDGDLHSREVISFASQLANKGAKVGNLDLSCYSGRSQPDTQKPFCTITLASASYVSICSASAIEKSFTQGLIGELRNNQNKTLEDLYLGARRKDYTGINVPQISSFKSPLDPILGKVLVQSDPACLDDMDKIGHMGQTAAQCQKQNPNAVFEKLNELRGTLDRAHGASLKKAIGSVYRTRNELEVLIPKLTQKTFVPFQVDQLATKATGLNTPLTIGDWLKGMNIFDFEGVIAMMDEFGTPEAVNKATWLDAETKQLYRDTLLPHADEVKAIYQSRVKNAPEVKEYKTLVSRLDTESRAMMVSERLLYDQIYKTGGGDPCSSYTL